MINRIRLLRPEHWIKNILVLLPLVTAHKLYDVPLLIKALIGTAVFCLLSSVIYIINDINDIETDKLHPKKCRRPLASGAVSIPTAKAMIVLLLALIIAAGIFSFGDNVTAWAVLACYLIANIAYSVKLKHIAIADIFILASGYVLRIYFCSALTGIEISGWLFLTLTSGALFLALGKRCGEFRKQGSSGETRKVLLSYTDSFLDKSMYMCEAITIIFYSLWSIDSITITQSSNDKIIFTVPFVIIIFMRYDLLIERGDDGDPVSTLMNDKPLLAICLVFVLVFLGMLYL